MSVDRSWQGGGGGNVTVDVCYCSYCNGESTRTNHPSKPEIQTRPLLHLSSILCSGEVQPEGAGRLDEHLHKV